MVLLKLSEIRRLVLRNLKLKGFSDNEAGVICDSLMYAELRGNNQGLVKLKDIYCSPQGPITIEKDLTSSLLLNGNYNNAMVVVDKALEMGIKRVVIVPAKQIYRIS